MSRPTPTLVTGMLMEDAATSTGYGSAVVTVITILWCVSGLTASAQVKLGTQIDLHLVPQSVDYPTPSPSTYQDGGM